jgi:protein-tyrosine phosphatase/arsenate reductase
MYKTIQELLDELSKQFNTISDERKTLLFQISKYIQEKKNNGLAIQLVYICTHNSRRSHFGQIAATIVANYYNIKNVESYSGGTEITAFNINAINALEKLGFEIVTNDLNNNPLYKVFYDEENYVSCFSKKYNDDANPKNNFLAIMTCSDADENCPLILGAENRISTTYEDPKKSDGTELQEQIYKERFKQIALETLYVFSLVK